MNNGTTQNQHLGEINPMSMDEQQATRALGQSIFVPPDQPQPVSMQEYEDEEQTQNVIEMHVSNITATSD